MSFVRCRSCCYGSVSTSCPVYASRLCRRVISRGDFSRRRLLRGRSSTESEVVSEIDPLRDSFSVLLGSSELAEPLRCWSVASSSEELAWSTLSGLPEAFGVAFLALGFGGMVGLCSLPPSEAH